MKKLGCALVAVAALGFAVPAPAFAGSSTDAALALGAFAVFNQLARGETVLHDIFGGPRVAQQAVVVQPPPPVVYAPPPAVVYVPPPAVVYAPPPPPQVIYAPPPTVVYSQPTVVYQSAPSYRFVPPGHWKHGHWKRFRHEDDDD